MKKISPLFTRKNLLLICLFCLGITYGQGNSIANKTLFGKQVRAENINPNNGKIRCATTEYEKYLQESNPKRLNDAQFEAWVAPLVSKYKAMRSSSKTTGTVITIPVVVHIIHNGQAIGVAPNITDNQVVSQITVLNQDFRRMLGTPGYNTKSVGADTEIQFVLAQQDPNGNPTNGIDRVSLCQPSWSEVDLNTTVKPNTIWDPTMYMNMWCVEFTDKTLLGYAQYPNASSLPGIDNVNGASNSDGVVSSYDVFGSKSFTDGTFLLSSPYDEGRTMSHEVGHWLGLRHIWGDATCGDDSCADTPKHHDANYGCPTVVNCDSNGNEMVENYMDYTNDACMNIFTADQKARMITVMNNSPRRKELKTSTKATPLSLFANDAEVKLEASCPVSICGAVTTKTTKNIILYNRGTSILTSATLNYIINSGSSVVNNWTGSLAANKFAIINIPINSTSDGTISVSVVKANGVTDQRASNNTTSGSFIIPKTPINYTFNTLNFTLQQDFFGSETTWNIKDGAGNVKYSGGPYTDTYVDDNTLSVLPAKITQSWTLANDQCYTFTIKDSSGDGICCGSGIGDSGDGFYNITSSDDSVVVKSGSAFTSSESISFTINSLATVDFEKSDEIYLYPNPTKGILNIQLPNGISLPNSYTIHNSLGQMISQKKISMASDLSINSSLLSNGVYFITIVKENQKKTLQFIKE